MWASGCQAIAGVDEVGKGSWAGPLTVGIAIIPSDRRLYGVKDSKQLTERRREQLFDRIAAWCVDWSVGHASPAECDELGMTAAQLLATDRAIAALHIQPDAYLVDGRWDFVKRERVTTLVKGDDRSLSIAAASILAKVSRDRIVRALDESYPAYNLASNKGYRCATHELALVGYGPSAIHRKTWAFMDRTPWTSASWPARG